MSADDGAWLGDDDGFDPNLPTTCLPTISKGPVSLSFPALASTEPEQDDENEGEDLWQTEDEPVAISVSSHESEEVEDLPDPDALFLRMQSQLEGVSLASESELACDDDDLPDPDALFLQMQRLGDSPADSGEFPDAQALFQEMRARTAAEAQPDDDLPDPDALFLQMQGLVDQQADSDGHHDPADEVDDLPDPNELYLQLRALEAASEDISDLPDPSALFLRMQSDGGRQDDRTQDDGTAAEDDEFPEADELFLKFRTLDIGLDELVEECEEVVQESEEVVEEPDELVEESDEFVLEPEEFVEEFDEFVLEPNEFVHEPNEVVEAFEEFFEEPDELGEEFEDLPDGDELFQEMQRRNSLLIIPDEDDLPDPDALFLQMRDQEIEIEAPTDSDVLPDPTALFLQMQAHHLSQETSSNLPLVTDSHNSGREAPSTGSLYEEEEEWFAPLPRPTSPHSDVGPEIEKLGLFGRLKAKFSRKVEVSEPSPSSQYDESDSRETLPDPSELFRRMQADDAEELAEDLAFGIAHGSSPTLPDPDELFRRMEAEDLEISEPEFATLKSPEELPALPDLDAFRAELEAEEMSRLDADLLGDLSGPERFADTVSDLAFNAGTFFEKAPTTGAIHKSPVHRQSKRPVEEFVDDTPLPAMLGGPTPRPQRLAPDPMAGETIRVPDPASTDSGSAELPDYIPAQAKKPSKSKRSTTEVARQGPASPAATVGLVQRVRKAWRSPRKLTRHGLSIFTRQLAAMLKAGIALHQCISFCAEADPDAEPILRDVVKKIESGYTLSGALHEYPDSFDPVFIGLVHSGELSGRLNDMLERLADILEREIELRKRMISVVTYPAVLLAVSMLGTLGFIFFILPQLTPLFLDLKVDLPWPTQVLLSLRGVLLPLTTVGVLAVVILWFSKSKVSAFIKARPHIERRLAAFPLSIPVIGGVYEKLITARVLYSMATMLEVGVTMSQALARAEGTSGNAFVGYRLARARADLADGASVTECFQVNQVFPETAMQLIAAGEESARIVEMFSYVARHFDEEVEHSMDAAASLLEPIIMVVMGCIVGFIVIASALPTIQLLQNFG